MAQLSMTQLARMTAASRGQIRHSGRMDLTMTASRASRMIPMPHTVTTRRVERPKASIYRCIRRYAETSIMIVSTAVSAHRIRMPVFLRNRDRAGRIRHRVSRATSTSWKKPLRA